jgi:hypothetical protein
MTAAHGSTCLPQKGFTHPGDPAPIPRMPEIKLTFWNVGNLNDQAALLSRSL